MVNPWSSLRVRALLLLACAFAVMLGMTGYHVVSERSERLANIKQHLQHTAEMIAAEQENVFEHAEGMLLQLTLDPAIVQAKSDPDCANALSVILHQRPEFTNMGRVDVKGDIVCNATPSPQVVNVADRAYFQQALKAKDAVLTEVLVARTTGKPAITFARAIRDKSGQARGVAFVSLDLSWIGRQLLSVRRPQGARLALVDANGIVLARDPYTNGWIGRSVVDVQLYKTLMAKGGDGTAEVSGAEGSAIIYAFARFADTVAGPIFLWVGVEKAVAMAPSEQGFIWTVLAAIVLLVLTFGSLSIGGSRWFLRPVAALSAAAERLRRGDLSARTGLARSDDELGRLARAFDDMAAAIEVNEQQIRRSTRALRVLSTGNRTLFRTKNEFALLGDMCRVVVEAGGYRMAWVGFAEDDAEKSVRPAASFAAPLGFLQDLQISWAQTERGMGPVGVAIRDGAPVATQNIQSDPPLKPWRELALTYGYSSVLALPLRAQAAVIGALVIYAEEPDAFDETEVKLLLEAADDLSFGIAAHRVRAREQRLEASLKTAEERFRAAAEANLDALFILRSVRDDRGEIADFEFSDINASAEKMFGIARGQAIGQRLSNVLPLRRIPGLIDKYVQVVKTGKPMDEEFPVDVLERDMQWLRQQVITVGEGVAISSRDVTMARSAAVALLQSERRYRMLFDANPLPMWVYETKTLGFLAVNEAAVRQYGYSADEFMRMTIADIRPPEDVSKLRANIPGKDSGLWRSGHWRHVKKSGEVIDVDIVSHQIDYSGKVARLVLANDITKRMQAENSVKEMNACLERKVTERTAELEFANRELEAFSYSVSHDLRAPLRAISGYWSLLQACDLSALSADARDMLTRIGANAGKMTELIDDILRFSRLGRDKLNRIEVDLHDLARQVVEEVREPYAAADVRVDPLPKAMGDAAMLRQVLANLIGNALKFSAKRDKPKIEIGHTQANGESAYFVKDNGTGFDAKYADRLFKMFQRLHRESEFSGTGIGLTIVKRIVERHGGRVWATSEMGQGATFYFTLGSAA